MPQIYVLDQNVPPWAILVRWPPDLQLIALTQYDLTLTVPDDWELLETLHSRGDVNGLITIDGRMLNQPKEMVILRQSRLRSS